MEDKLREIGFYTLEDDRAKNVSTKTPLWRCELLLTTRCNFKCPYCRGVKPEYRGDLSYCETAQIVKLWANHGLKNIRFSGGEPTLWPKLADLVKYARDLGIERAAISTNGSASFSKYAELLESGVNDFSISFDACCSATGDIMAGKKGAYEIVTRNIKILSKLTYVTVGVVLTETNASEINEIAQTAVDLGVSDVRLITAAQLEKYLPADIIFPVGKKEYPILKYRIGNIRNNKPIRGISKEDNPKCPLVLDDMAILKGKHYPCIIYLREQGAPIGSIDKMDVVRAQRKAWYENVNCYENDICRNNCLDVCVDYNNRVRELQGE